MTTFDYLDLPHPADDDRRPAPHRCGPAPSSRRATGRAGSACSPTDGVVQDPVGVSFLDETGEGHRGHEGIGAFWDNVIATNPVRMDIISSHAGGDEVANYLTITTTFPDGSNVAGEMVAIYRVDEAGKVRSLRAFWEIDQLRFTAAPS